MRFPHRQYVVDGLDHRIGHSRHQLEFSNTFSSSAGVLAPRTEASGVANAMIEAWWTFLIVDEDAYHAGLPVVQGKGMVQRAQSCQRCCVLGS
jgi:hypothetical protein